MKSRMRIAFASSEVTPFAKTGGLADVARSLPGALAKLGHELMVFLPKYKVIHVEKHRLVKRPERIAVPLHHQVEEGELWERELDGVRVLFLGHEGFYGREGLYQEKGQDYPDNAERFIFFSRGILETLKVLGWAPEIIHCNDWQTSLIPAYLKTLYRKESLLIGVSTLLTIHNLGYQGLFPAETFALTGLPMELFTSRGMEFWGKMNFLKAGLVYADLLTTVSHRYSQEIQTPEFGYGLDGLLRERAADLFGILNGVDYQDWNPRTDPYLVANYSSEDLKGKAACKRDLQEVMGLPSRGEVPLLGVISRLAYQKGIDLIAKIAEDLLILDLQVVLLGTGEVEMERTFQSLQQKFQDKLRVRIGFDVPLSHKIEAGADMFLMPSRYEPCGLNQMYSLAYGTIPIVRATGGLDDTITPFDPITGEGNGFKFLHADPEELLQTIRRAIALFRQKVLWTYLMQNAMAADFSWERSARQYVRLYQSALERPKGSGKS